MKSSAIAVGIALAVCGPRPAPAQPTDPEYDAAIRAVAARPEVRRALALVRVLERTAEPTLIELTQIPAPPFGEAARGRRFAELLRATGLADVTVDAPGNVIARRAGTAGPEAVAVVAHLDTVFHAGTDLTVHRRGDRLYAPGIGDDTRGLVVLLIIAEALERAGVRTRADILFVGSVGEEGLGDLRGVRHLLRPGGPRIDRFIAIDGGSDEEVVNQALGSRRYRAVLTGPGGHSWGDFGLANPAHALARAIDYFDRAASGVSGVGATASYSVGRIGGGTSVNAVPREAWAEIDMRATDPERLDRLDAALRSSVARAVDEHNRSRDRGVPLAAELELIGDRPSGLVSPRAPLVRHAVAATRYFGLQARLGVASTDANLPIARGIPAVALSRGGAGGGAHSLDEWWAPRNAHIGSQRALLLLVASAGVAR